MTYTVKVHIGDFGRANGLIEHSNVHRDDRPTYPGQVAGRHYWWSSDEAHDPILGKYKIEYRVPHWLIIFEDPKEAARFKLTWGNVG